MDLGRKGKEANVPYGGKKGTSVRAREAVGVVGARREEGVEQRATKRKRRRDARSSPGRDARSSKGSERKRSKKKKG